MKIILVLLVSVLALSCTTDKTVDAGTLRVPDQFLGTYVGVQTKYSALIQSNKITLETDEGIVVRNNGTVTVNTSNHWEVDLGNNERIVLLKGAYLGITMYRDGDWVISDYYVKQ